MASTWAVYFTLAAVYGGLLLLMRVWWGMTRLYSRCPGVPIKRMMWVFALWALPMLVIAPLFSRDVYSYAAQGEMVSHHMSPYLYGPAQLGNNSYTAPVDQLWANAPAPYGPLFLQIDGIFARITFHNELATIVLLRLLALVGVLLIASCVPRLARLYHRDGAELFTLMILNPVTLLHLIGGAHNDALMLGLLVAGLTAAKEKRPIVGIVLCALATAIKAPAAFGILYVGWSWLGPQASVRDRIRPVVTAGLLGAGVLGFFSYVSGLGWGWVTILGTPGAVRSWTAPTTSLALAFTGIAHFVHIGVGLGGVLSVTRFFGLLVAGIAGVWLLFNSDRIGTLKALGITLLLLVALGPVVQPWYLSWGLILLAPVALGRLRSLIIGLSMVTAFIELPGGTDLVHSLIHGDPLEIVLTLLWILFVLTVPLATWERRSSVPRVATADGVLAGCLRSGRASRLPDGPIGSDQELEDGHVEPPAEFATDLPLHPDQGEAARLMEGDGRQVVPADPGDDGVEAVLGGQLDEVLDEGPAHPLAPMGGVHVHRILHRGGVGRAVLVLRERAESEDGVPFVGRHHRRIGTAVVG